jgi:RimJ/RimL family protein N-acetyltransferase
MRDAWGKGYATEAGAAALRWGFDTLLADEIVSAILPGNAASIRVAERLGERYLREDKLHGKTCLIYGMTKAEWRAR